MCRHALHIVYIFETLSIIGTKGVIEMAICSFCKKDMLNADGCDVTAMCKEE